MSRQYCRLFVYLLLTENIDVNIYKLFFMKTNENITIITFCLADDLLIYLLVDGRRKYFAFYIDKINFCFCLFCLLQ